MIHSKRNSCTFLKYDLQGSNTFEVPPSAIEILDIDCKTDAEPLFMLQIELDESQEGLGSVEIESYLGMGPTDDLMSSPTAFGFPCLLGGVTNPGIVFTSSSVIQPIVIKSKTTNLLLSPSDGMKRIPRYVRYKFHNKTKKSCRIKIMSDSNSL